MSLLSLLGISKDFSGGKLDESLSGGKRDYSRVYSGLLIAGSLGVAGGCMSLTDYEKESLRELERYNIPPQEKKVKDPATAGWLNLLPGVGNFYLGSGTKDNNQTTYGVLNLLTWPLSITWGIPQAVSDAKIINKKTTVEYYFKDPEGKRELCKISGIRRGGRKRGNLMGGRIIKKVVLLPEIEPWRYKPYYRVTEKINLILTFNWEDSNKNGKVDEEEVKVTRNFKSGEDVSVHFVCYNLPFYNFFGRNKPNKTRVKTRIYRKRDKKFVFGKKEEFIADDKKRAKRFEYHLKKNLESGKYIIEVNMSDEKNNNWNRKEIFQIIDKRTGLRRDYNKKRGISEIKPVVFSVPETKKRIRRQPDKTKTGVIKDSGIVKVSETLEGKVKKKFKLGGNFLFTCNYAEDRDKNNRISFEEVVGIKEKFDKGERVSAIFRSSEGLAGKLMEFEVLDNSRRTMFLKRIVGDNDQQKRTYCFEMNNKLLIPGTYFVVFSVKDKSKEARFKVIK